MNKWEYRQKWYNESEAEAKAALSESMLDEVDEE